MKIQLKFTAIVMLAALLAFTACGSDSGDDPVTPVIHAIGDSYGGGIVAYILLPGDPGYDANVQHGLIAATEDQIASICWAVPAYQSVTVPAPGAIGTAIGTGLTNTNAIVAQNDPTSSGLTTYAAGLARAYTGGGYTDWYLPSQDELNKLYLNRAAIGGFSGGYWSSSEQLAHLAYAQNFNDGVQSNAGKSGTIGVRAVRAF
jgi:hypothetical protein